MTYILHNTYINSYTAKLNNLYFHPLEVVSRYRDTQLQVGEKNTHTRLFRDQTFANLDV